MGAAWIEGTIALSGRRAHKKVREIINARIEEETIEYGTNPYSGSLATKGVGNIEFLERSFRTVKAAEDNLVDRACKHGPILAARITNKGEPFWYYCCWAPE